MKNNFDLKGYMKENKTGAYQQLNEMWYSDMQAIGQPMGMRHTAINEEEAVEEQELEETKFEDAIGPIKKTMAALGYEGEYDPTIIEGYIFTKDFADGVMEIVLTSLYDDKEKFTFTAAYFPKINQSQFFGLLKKQVIDYKNGKIVSDDVEHVDLGTGMFSLDEPGVENLIKSMVSKVESKANTKGADELEEMGGVKTIGDAGKMATPNSRPNLGRHRSSDMLDKMSKKDHKTNTVVGAKAAAYKAPHMKEEETADDIFAGSDTADWNGKAERMDWEKDLVGKEVGNWKSDIEQQAGSISWTSEKYPNAIIYATPGWEGVDGIAVEVHESEEGFMDEPKLQKVVAAGTDAWKTKEGYLALMAKIFTTLEKMLTPAEMTEDDGTGRQINHDFNDDISKDPSEFEDAIQEGMQDWNHTFKEDIMDLLDDGISKPEILTHFKDILKNANSRMEESIEEDEDPFGSIKGGIDKITQGDDDMDMSDDDRFDQLGGDKIKAGIEGLMGDGFDYREILQFVKDTIASKRNY